jgi:hypothetical protein
MELLLLAILALGVLVFLSYPVNGHGSGYYPYFGPDGDRGPQDVGSGSRDGSAD